MYALLLLALPWALGITRRWGPLPLLIIAVSLWTLAMGGRTYNWMGEQLAPMDLRPPYFDLVAWQLLFWIGLICGCARVLNSAWLKTIVRWCWIPGLAFAIFCLCIRYDGDMTNWIVTKFDFRASTNIPWLGWFRLLNFLALAAAVAGLSKLAPILFKWPWFSLLGRHSLQVYTAHIAIVFLSAPIGGWIKGSNSTNWDYTLTAASLVILTLTAFLHQLWLGYLQKKRMQKSD